jgi:hypothetical protein
MAIAFATGANAAVPVNSALPLASEAPNSIDQQNRVIRELFERLVKGPTGKPGVWLDVEGRGINRYTRTDQGYLRTTSDFDSDGAPRTPWTVSYNVDRARGIVIMNNGVRDFTLDYAQDGKDQYRSSRHSVPSVPDEAEYIQTTRFSGDGKEVVSGGETDHAVWLSESDAMAQQAVKAKLVAARTELKRTQDRLEAVQAEARQRQMEADLRRREEAQADQDAQVARLEGDRVIANAEWEAESRRSEKALEDSLQRLRGTVAQYEALAKLPNPPEESAPNRSASPASVPDGYIEIADKPVETAAPRPAEAQAPARGQGNDEHLFGFLGASCETAIKNAHMYYGTGSTFAVAHRIPQSDGLCLIQVDIDSVVRGASGTASRQ